MPEGNSLILLGIIYVCCTSLRRENTLIQSILLILLVFMWFLYGATRCATLIVATQS